MATLYSCPNCPSMEFQKDPNGGYTCLVCGFRSKQLTPTIKKTKHNITDHPLPSESIPAMDDEERAALGLIPSDSDAAEEPAPDDVVSAMAVNPTTDPDRTEDPGSEGDPQAPPGG